MSLGDSFTQISTFGYAAMCHQRSFALQAAWFLIFIFALAASLFFAFLLSQ